MNKYKSNIQVKFSGDHALFTRPEGKVERVSYPIMTPSAARGALEAILWKPKFYYEIRSITVLKRPKFYSLVRNEVSDKAPFRMRQEDRYTDDMRQLRYSLVLKDVEYIVEADIVLHSENSTDLIKYEQMFDRRLTKGQCFQRPYLGTREFAAQFSKPTGSETPIDWTDTLGSMFFDYKYPTKGNVAIPYFFSAKVNKGVMEVPRYLYREVRG